MRPAARSLSITGRTRLSLSAVSDATLRVVTNAVIRARERLTATTTSAKNRLPKIAAERSREVCVLICLHMCSVTRIAFHVTQIGTEHRMLQPLATRLFPELDGQFPMDGSDGTGALPLAGSPAAQIVIHGRRLEPTPVFDTYWRFAAARQALYEARLRGQAAPWTSDPILRRHRFTNCYRAADRVSQFLISQVIYEGSQEPGRSCVPDAAVQGVQPHSHLAAPEGGLRRGVLAGVRLRPLRARAHSAFASGERLYSAAYVVPPPAFGEDRKHANHLRLLELMMSTGVAGKVRSAGSLRGAFEVLRSYPAIGELSRLPVRDRPELLAGARL